MAAYGVIESPVGTTPSLQSTLTTQGVSLAAHQQGTCEPCAFFTLKKDGCRRGAACKFCHFCTKEQRRWRSTLQRNIFKESKRSSACSPMNAIDAEKSEPIIVAHSDTYSCTEEDEFVIFPAMNGSIDFNTAVGPSQGRSDGTLENGAHGVSSERKDKLRRCDSSTSACSTSASTYNPLGEDTDAAEATPSSASRSAAGTPRPLERCDTSSSVGAEPWDEKCEQGETIAEIPGTSSGFPGVSLGAHAAPHADARELSCSASRTDSDVEEWWLCVKNTFINFDIAVETPLQRRSKSSPPSQG